MSSWCPRATVLIFCGVATSSCFAGEGTETIESGPAAPAGPAAPIGPTGPTVPDEPPTGDVRPAPEGVPSLQMSPNFISPALAFGGYFPTPQMESGAIRVEPFTIRATVNTGIGYDDNVALTTTNKISSMFFTLAPSVAVGLEGATQRYYALYRGNYGTYSSASGSNYENHNFSLHAFNEWSTRLRTAAQYDFLRGNDPRGSTETAIQAPDFWNLNTLRGTVTYGAAGAPAWISANLAYLNRRYTSNHEVTAIRDYDRWDVGGQFSYRIAPKTRASVEIIHSDITHQRQPLADSTENRYLLGLDWEATAKTQGRVRVGYLTRDFSDPARETFSAATYEATATWSPMPFSVVALNASRTAAEAIEVGSNLVLVDVASVSWSHTWFERVRSTVGYLHGQQKHEGIGRSDTYQTFDAKLSYGIHRRVRLGLQFRHDTRDSPEPGFEYRRNLTLITLESAL